MADIKISELTAALTVSDADVLPMTASGSTVKVTTALLKEHAIGDTDISGVGDGSVTGAIDSLDDEDTTIKAMIAPTETSPTVNSWTTGAQFIYNDVLYDVIADITASDALTVGTNIAAADTLAEQIVDAVGDIAQNASDITSLGSSKMSYAANTKLGAHNLLECTGTTQTLTDVTFSVDSQGIVTTSGTSTAVAPSNRSVFQYNSRFILDPSKTYRLSGCPVGGGSNTYDVMINFNDSQGQYISNVADEGNGVIFTPPSNASYAIAYVRCYRGVNVTGKVFKPMLTLAEDTDDTFEPYAMTNRKLTPKKVTVTGTTSAGGNITIASSAQANRIILFAYCSNERIATLLRQTSGATMAHITAASTSMEAITNTEVTVTYYYIEV